MNLTVICISVLFYKGNHLPVRQIIYEIHWLPSKLEGSIIAAGVESFKKLKTFSPSSFLKPLEYYMLQEMRNDSSNNTEEDDKGGGRRRTIMMKRRKIIMTRT